MLLLSVYIFLITMGAADPSGTDLLKILSNASGPTLLAVIVIGAVKEWWVPGKTHRRIVAERDDLLQLIVSGQQVGRRAVEVVETLTEAVKRDKKTET